MTEHKEFDGERAYSDGRDGDAPAKIGRFSASLDLVQGGGAAVAALFTGLIIIRAEPRLDRRTIEYIAIGHEFRPIPPGELIPLYLPMIRTTAIPARGGRVDVVFQIDWVEQHGICDRPGCVEAANRAAMLGPVVEAMRKATPVLEMLAANGAEALTDKVWIDLRRLSREFRELSIERRMVPDAAP